MKAFILAGGFGSKLREVIYNQPKILASIKGQAFIDHLFYLLKKNGFTEVVIGLGYLSDMVKDYVTHRTLYDLNVMYSIEPRPLGTAGALKNAEKFLDTPFFVINGDTYLDIDYGEVFKFHQEKKSLVTIVTAKSKYSGGFGNVLMDGDSKLKGITPGKADSVGELVHAGVYIVDPQVLDLIPKGRKSSFEKDILPDLIKKGKVYAYNCHKTFFDIGDANGFALAQQKIER
jgi:mannose-1-phosphate guanylyltransferase/phosphomannomutase